MSTDERTKRRLHETPPRLFTTPHFTRLTDAMDPAGRRPFRPGRRTSAGPMLLEGRPVPPA